MSDGAEVPWPSYTDAFDYELELGFVLARPLLDATPAEAAIGGFVVLNDFTARDVQRPEMQSGFGPQKSKHFCTAISAVVVPAGEVLPRLGDLRGRVLINGAVVAECSAAGPRFSFGEALAHASRDEALRPGEFFCRPMTSTGDPVCSARSRRDAGSWTAPRRAGSPPVRTTSAA